MPIILLTKSSFASTLRSPDSGLITTVVKRDGGFDLHTQICDFVTCDFVTLRRLNMGGGKRWYYNLYIINNNYILFIYSYIAGRGAHISEVLNVTKSHVTVSTLWALG